MRYKKLNLIEQVSQKNRNKFYNKKIKKSLEFTSLINFKNCRFEINYFIIIKKHLKVVTKVKYLSYNFLKVWLFLNLNFPIRQKSKNARMGKGIGSFIRWSSKIPRGFKIALFKNINYNRIKKLVNFWNKLINTKIIII